MNKPKLFLLDEPLAGLDSKSKDIILKALKNMKDKGVSLLITEHLISDDILSFIDRVWLIDQTSLFEYETVKKFKNSDQAKVYYR